MVLDTTATKVIPKGYTFLNEKMFLSENAKKIVMDLLEQTDNRDPDGHAMYIYNDFFSYAILNLVDTSLSKINTKVRQKKWDEAMELLEALVLYFTLQGYWTQCDDGDRVGITNNAFGALLVTVLRAVKKDSRLDTTHFPSLETLLRFAAEWDDGLDDTAGYYRICKALGYRLFKDKTEADREIEKARIDEWVASMDKEEKDEYLKFKEDGDEDEDEEEEEESSKDWFAEGKKFNEDEKIKEIGLARAWKEYKEYLQDVPTMPLRGPPQWDLTKWSDLDKKPFLFSNQGDGDDDMF